MCASASKSESLVIARDEIDRLGWEYDGIGAGPNILFSKIVNGRVAERMVWDGRTHVAEIKKEKK
jgi:hypothetical protein